MKIPVSGSCAADMGFAGTIASLAAKRPPILRDFFNTRIAKPLLTKRIELTVEVEIKVRTSSSVAA